MTILVSSVSPSIIVMLSDSAVTVTHYQDDGDAYNEYETGSKYYILPGVGCITTWGDRTHNRLGQYLRQQQISPKTHSIKDVAELTHKYISDEYTKDEELGFHIGGFDETGKPCLFHVFWGFDRPTPPQQTEPASHLNDHSDWVFLYNGRNDLANVVIAALKEQIDNGQDVRFDIKTSLGRISLCDFIARFASEITPQVSPPFVMNLIFPDNSIEKVENTSYSPISLQSIVSVIPKLSPTPNFPPANENVALEAPRIQPSGWMSAETSNDEPPHEETQGGTISYFRPRKKGG